MCYLDLFELFCNLADALIVRVRLPDGTFRTMTGCTVSGIPLPRWRLDGHHGLEIEIEITEVKMNLSNFN